VRLLRAGLVPVMALADRCGLSGLAAWFIVPKIFSFRVRHELEQHHQGTERADK
jgi:hypothetical protein